jgi:hypothetical protein
MHGRILSGDSDIIAVTRCRQVYYRSVLRLVVESYAVLVATAYVLSHTNSRPPARLLMRRFSPASLSFLHTAYVDAFCQSMYGNKRVYLRICVLCTSTNRYIDPHSAFAFAEASSRGGRARSSRLCPLSICPVLFL